MRNFKLFFSLIFLIFITSEIFCQNLWDWQNPKPVGTCLFTIENVGNTIYAAGEAGTIIKSADNGVNWSVYETVGDFEGTFHKLHFFGENRGIVLGDEGTIFYTQNSGASWQKMNTGTTADLRDFAYKEDIANDKSFPSNALGLAVGANGAILRTLSSNPVWSVLVPQEKCDFYTVAVLSSRVAFVGGEYGAIFRTTDTGNSWNQVTTNSNQRINHIYFIDNLTGFAVGQNGTILKSDNSGLDWKDVGILGNYDLYKISFSNSKQGMIIGSGGKVFITHNGGYNWNEPNCEPIARNNLYSICNTMESRCFISGQDGILLSSTDNGLNWKNHTKYTTTNTLNQISFLSKNLGFAAGNGGIFLRTHNAGYTWDYLHTGELDNINSFVVYDYPVDRMDKTIVAVGNNGLIIRSEDGGDTWLRNPLRGNFHLNSIAMADGNTIYAVGENGIFFKSLNSGMDWIRVKGPYWVDWNEIIFVNERCGFIVGSEGCMLKTMDGGESWKSLSHYSSKDLYSVSFINEKKGIAVGADGKIMATFNGGESWISKQTDEQVNLFDVKMIDNNYALISGDEGTFYWIYAEEGRSILVTKIESATCDDLNCIGVSPTGKIYVAGQHGNILQMNNQTRLENIYQLPELAKTNITLPKEFSLAQNYPNPFNPQTTIEFTIPENGFVTLKVYDLLGNEVESLVEGNIEAGFHYAAFDAARLSSGVYIYRLTTNKFTQMRKMVLLK